MKKLSAFISQFYSVYCESFSPVQILIVQPGVELFFNCISEVGLWVKKATPVFQGIKKADNLITALGLIVAYSILSARLEEI
jgi:hypothetical protein